MAETRMYPKSTPRSTGIPRVTTQTARPYTAAGSSHVSASPGAGHVVREHVMAARNPAAARREHAEAAAPAPAALPAGARPAVPSARPATPAGARAAGARPAAPAAPAGAPLRHVVAQGGTQTAVRRPSVQLMSRADAGVAAAYGTPATPSSPFTLDHLMLLAHLLEKFQRETAGDAEKANAEVATGALGVVQELLSSFRPATPVAPVAPLAPAPGVASAGLAHAPDGFPMFDVTPQVVVIPAVSRATSGVTPTPPAPQAGAASPDTGSGDDADSGVHPEVPGAA